MKILVVLGGPNSPDGVLSTISKSRLNYCKTVFRPGELVICTGGWGPQFNVSLKPHAFYAKAYLIKKGLVERDFLPNALSVNTVDDAVKVKAIIADIKNPELVIITSDFHLKRVQLIFNEILEDCELEFVGVESTLEKEKLDALLQHEQIAIKAILEHGLQH